MAAVAGLVFVVVLLSAPGRGLVALAVRRRRQRTEFAGVMLAIHLLQHEGTAEAEVESREEHLHHHLRCTPEFARRIVRHAAGRELIHRDDGSLALTEQGRVTARTALGQ